MKKALLIIFTITLTQVIISQEITHLNTKNSKLIDDKIWSVGVDLNGNKWLGTEESGLLKYDEKEFITFNSSNSVIKGKFIAPIFVDSKNNIWVVFSKPNGLVKYDGENWTIYSTEEIKLSKISIIDITEDENGIIYFGGSYGLTSFDGNKWTKIELPKSITIRSLAIKNKDEIFIGHNEGLLVYKNKRWSLLNEKNSELQSYVRELKFHNQDELYIGYGGNLKGGFSILKDDKWEHINKDNSNLSDNMVRDIEFGYKNLLWMATNNGLNVMKNNKIVPLFFRERGNAIIDIAIDNSKVWVATHYGLYKIEI